MILKILAVIGCLYSVKTEYKNYLFVNKIYVFPQDAI